MSKLNFKLGFLTMGWRLALFEQAGVAQLFPTLSDAQLKTEKSNLDTGMYDKAKTQQCQSRGGTWEVFRSGWAHCLEPGLPIGWSNLEETGTLVSTSPLLPTTIVVPVSATCWNVLHPGSLTGAAEDNPPGCCCVSVH